MLEKNMIFNIQGKVMKKKNYIDNTHINITAEYKYLGTIFSPSGSFSTAAKHLANKARKATFSIRNIFPPNRLAIIEKLKIFDACIKPILLYNTEVWAPDMIIHDKKRLEKCYLTNFIPENMHIQFIKHTHGVNKSADNKSSPTQSKQDIAN